MRSINPLFENAVIDCVATDRQPSVQELFRVAQRIWLDGAADRSAFRWGRLAPTDAEKLLALRAAQVALSGSVARDA
ncbi:hypothetical protein [Sphingomonas sp. TREG-RG-20F-R18-01]|uniref:hypothetical protein n=1 Tax=Sphingomonas sp. TREG-RG-20F-R18-01 TaxID=2914982 RepID=UPI001F5A5037|nr:hypothetical protein [Sphingomonas sp. TREG-RG-20F-R18-01]